MNKAVENATFVPSTPNSTVHVRVVSIDYFFVRFMSLIVFSILSSIGTILDIFVIYVMVRSGQLRKNISSFFIFHLSLTHLLFHIVFAMTFTRGLQKRDVVMCKVSAFIEHACPAAIFSTLVAIAWDRHKNILQPFKSLISKPLKSYLMMVAVIWIYSGLSSVSFVNSVTVQSVNYCRTVNNTQQCEKYMICETPSDWAIQVSQTIYFIVAFVIPPSYMTVAYTRIAVRLWKRSKNGMIHSAVAKHKSKSIRLLVVAVLGFVLCWGPSILTNMLHEYEAMDGLAREERFILMFWLTAIVPASSSCINTAIYAFFCPEFRKNSIKFACCCCCCRSCRVISSNHRVGPREIRMKKTRHRRRLYSDVDSNVGK